MRAILMPTHVGLDVGAHLQLQHGEAFGDGLLGESLDLVVVVAQPTCGRGVGRQAVGFECSDAIGPSAGERFEMFEGFGRGDRVVDVGEVDLLNDLGGCERRQHPPQRLAVDAGAQVPRGVDDRADGHVHDALLGTEPAQLAVPRQLAGERADIGDQRGDVAAEHVRATGCARLRMRRRCHVRS